MLGLLQDPLGSSVCYKVLGSEGEEGHLKQPHEDEADLRLSRVQTCHQGKSLEVVVWIQL